MKLTNHGSRAARLAAAWLRQLPLTPGGYAELLLPGWIEARRPDLPIERTSLAQLRLAYVFLHAGRLGVEGAADAGRAALDRANAVFWREDLRGWTRGADANGGPLDETVDTYDQAFGLLALAWDFDTAEGGLRAADARRRALAALAALDEGAAGAGGGFREFRNGVSASALVAFPGYRRQNPHMHLLEAFLAWHKADPHGPWLDRAAAMVELLKTRFLDRRSGVLREYFDDSWTAAGGDPGRSLEPGHHFEWVWLLGEFRKASGDESADLASERLYEFAAAKGVDGDGLAFDAVDGSGAVVAGTKLLWPQTEQLKARLAIREWKGDVEALGAARRLLGLISSLYLDEETGFFVNKLERDGRPAAGPTPSRVLYHLFLGLAEAERSGI